MKLSLGALMFWAGISWAQAASGLTFMVVCLIVSFLGGWLVDSALNGKVRK